jgi:hypothetical protein
MVSRFRHYGNLHKTEARLRQLLHDFRFSSLQRVLPMQLAATTSDRAMLR